MKLDQDTWTKIYPFLEQASDLDPAEIDTWLANLVAEQPDIGIPLRSVLVHGMETGDFLSGGLRLSAASSTRVGEVVGAYRIESILGSGGMGQVWLAQRTDGRFAGRFAVKFLDQTAPGAKNLERFQREGRVLARLAHPNIARLIDAGVVRDGQPYLVLEYVEGMPIDQYCDARSLDVRARVRLFLSVLAAIAHAHGKLIVHRDIKPANVFVTPDGTVKLLDFGIAKLIGSDLEPEERSEATRIEDVALTPDYAAPEQILGETPSTATDVYQLGALLFLLLVGRLPFARAGSRADKVRAALESVPLRLSEAADSGTRGELRGDLDAIVDKALRKRPEERYVTAAALAVDLQHYLDDEPVSARDGAFAYRAGKFVRRYRGPVIGTSMAAVALVAATAFALVKAREAQVQRDQSRALQKEAQAENQFLLQVMSTVSANGQPVTPAQILEKGMSLLDRQYADDPRFRVGMFVRMAARFQDMDDQDRALKALLKAEAVAKELNDPRRLAVIECNTVNSEVAMGDAGAAAQRLALGRAALSHIDAPGADVRADCLDAEASMSALRGDIRGALKLDQQALALVQDDPANAEQVDSLWSNIGYYYNELGDPKKVVEITQHQVDRFERNGLGESQNAITARSNLVVGLAGAGEYAPALAQQEIVIARARSATTDGLIDAHSLITYATLQCRLGKPEAAIQTYDLALAAAQRDKDLIVEALTHATRADALTQLGRLADAHAELAKVQALAKGQEPAYLRALFTAQGAAARLSLAEGKLAEARRQIDPLIDSLQHDPRANQITLARALLTAARIASAEGRQADAEQRAREALVVDEKLAIDPAASADVGEALLQLAKAVRDQGRTAEAKEAARRALGSLSVGLGPDHSLTHEAAGLAGV